MDEAYNYDVVIRGLDKIPLRTTAQGAKVLMQSFHDEPNMQNLLLEAVDGGTPFKNKLVSVTALEAKPKVQTIKYGKMVVKRTIKKPLTRKKR